MSWHIGIQINGIIQYSSMQLSGHLMQEEIHYGFGFSALYSNRWIMQLSSISGLHCSMFNAIISKVSSSQHITEYM